jgi:hypothetical protein
MLIYTYDEEYSNAIATLPPMPVTDLGSRWGWGWRCQECGRGHVEEFAQDGGIFTCEKCGKMYFCE